MDAGAMSDGGKRLATYLILTFALSSIFYYLIISAGGRYVLGLMWSPGVAALLTRSDPCLGRLGMLAARSGNAGGRRVAGRGSRPARPVPAARPPRPDARLDGLGLHSVQDEPDSFSWGGGNVFDVYARSLGTAMDGTRYREW